MTAMTQRPAYPDTNTGNIPQLLRERDQWVAWRWEWRPGKDGKPGKWTKIPVNPRTGRNAKTNDPATWGTLDEAVNRAIRDGIGIGYVFHESDPFTGIDFDDCLDPETGEVDPIALERIRALDSYTDPSPSGRGAKVIVVAKLPPGRRRIGKVEMYDDRRLFTLTGRHFPGAPTTIENRQEQIDQLHAELFPPQEAPAASRTVTLTLDDQDIIEKIRAARNGAKFDRLWSGDSSEYGGDESAADLAFVSMLTFYTDDHHQIDRIVRQSGRYREKWEREDYRRRTIEKALQRSAFYDPTPTASVPRSAPQTATSAVSATQPTNEATISDEFVASTDGAACAAERARIAELEQQLAREQERRMAAEARVKALEERLSLVFQVQRAKPIKQQAPVLLAALNEIASAESRGQAEAGGWVSTYRAAIAERASCGEKTVTTHLDVVADELGLLERRTVFRDKEIVDPDTGQTRVERVKVLQIRKPPEFASINDVMKAATTKTRENQPAWGGTRTPCPHCGGTEFEVRKITACTGCGTILEEQRTRMSVADAHESPVQAVKGQDDPLVDDTPPIPVDVAHTYLDGTELPFTPAPAADPPSKGASCAFSPAANPTCGYCPSPLYTPESIARGTCARHATMYPSQFPMAAGGAD